MRPARDRLGIAREEEEIPENQPHAGRVKVTNKFDTICNPLKTTRIQPPSRSKPKCMATTFTRLASGHLPPMFAWQHKEERVPTAPYLVPYLKARPELLARTEQDGDAVIALPYLWTSWRTIGSVSTLTISAQKD